MGPHCVNNAASSGHQEEDFAQIKNKEKQGRETTGAKEEEQHTVQKWCDTISRKAKQNGTKH